MFDRRASALLRPVVTRFARALAGAGVQADQLTIAGFLIGIVAAILIANNHYLTGTTAIFVSRICDALDGAVARQGTPTDRGAFLDITLDFLFYASIPLAFAFADPARNGLPAAVLLAAFIGTGSSFLAFAVLAAGHGMRDTGDAPKSFFFLGGLTEAGETLAFFAAMGLWPQNFSTLAFAFAALCAVTIATRLWWGWKTFG